MKRYHYFAILILLLLLVALLFYLEDRPDSIYKLDSRELAPKALQPVSPKVLTPQRQLSFFSKPINRPELKIDFIEENYKFESKPNSFPDIELESHLSARNVRPTFSPNVNFERPDLFSSAAFSAPIISNDLLSIIQKPLYWDDTDYLTLGAIGLGTYLLTTIDGNLDKHFKRNGEVANSTLLKSAEYFGRNTTLLYSAIGFNILGYISSEPELNLIGIELFEGFLVSENISNLFKFSFGRSRPYLNAGASQFNVFNPADNGERSLPSGHTTLAFTLSSVVASHVESNYLKALIYTPAILTGVERVYSNSHWLSDVFLGAAIGYFVGNTIASLHTFDRENKILIIGNARGELEFVIPL